MTQGRTDSSTDRGLSLIELVVAMAIFALVAVMGTQALTGMLRMRDGLTTRSEETAALAQAVSLLRADLSAMAPMLFFPPERAAPRSALRFSGAPGARQMALSRGGGPGAQAGLGLQRIDWQLRNGQLSRRIWPTLMPATARQQSPVMPVLAGVRDLRLRSYWEGPGWTDGVSAARLGAVLPGQAAADDDSVGTLSEQYSDSLPLAVELILVTEDFGEITLVETLK